MFPPLKWEGYDWRVRLSPPKELGLGLSHPDSLWRACVHR